METHEKDQAPAPANKPHSKVIPSFMSLGVIVAFLLGGMGGYALGISKNVSPDQMPSPQPTAPLAKNPLPSSMEWKTGTFGKCGTFKYPGIWQSHVEGENAVYFTTSLTFSVNGGKDKQMSGTVVGLDCGGLTNFNNYKDIEQFIQSKGTKQLQAYGYSITRIANNIDAVNVESPNKDEGYYMIIKNGRTISVRYYNRQEWGHEDSGQIAEEIVNSIIF